MKFTYIFFIFLFSLNAYGGEFKETVDKFDGSVTRSFQSTENEWLENDKILIVLRDFRPRDNTVNLIVASKSSVDCHKNYIELKTSEGEIHKINATEKGNIACIARVSADLIKNRFHIRVPLFRYKRGVGEIDTSTLDLTKIEEQKSE